MHISLDQALGRQPRLNRVGQSLLNIGSGASAAYSLRSLTGGDPKVVNVRRDADDEEREFTSTEVGTELEDWVNGKQETTIPLDIPAEPENVTGFTLSAGGANGTSAIDGTSGGKPAYDKDGNSFLEIFWANNKWNIIDTDEGEPEMGFRQRFGILTAAHLGKPVIETGENRKHGP